MSIGSGSKLKVETCVSFNHGDFNCQALSISQSLNLSLSLRDSDRADTIITLPHHPPTANFFKYLKVTDTQV